LFLERNRILISFIRQGELELWLLSLQEDPNESYTRFPWFISFLREGANNRPHYVEDLKHFCAEYYQLQGGFGSGQHTNKLDARRPSSAPLLKQPSPPKLPKSAASSHPHSCSHLRRSGSGLLERVLMDAEFTQEKPAIKKSASSHNLERDVLNMSGSDEGLTALCHKSKKVELY